jgi:hypothetical protein
MLRNLGSKSNKFLLLRHSPSHLHHRIAADIPALADSQTPVELDGLLGKYLEASLALRRSILGGLEYSVQDWIIAASL